MASSRQRHVGCICRARCFMAMTGIQDDPRALPRRGPGAHRHDRRYGRRAVRQHAVVDRAHQGPATLRAIAVTNRRSARRRLPDVPTVADTVPGYEASAWVRHRDAEGHGPRTSSRKVNKTVNAAAGPIPNSFARLADLGGAARWAERRADFRQGHGGRDRRSGKKGRRVLGREHRLSPPASTPLLRVRAARVSERQ